VKALICGAGIAGLTLAWWLERDGWQITLLERAPGPRDEGYMIDFVGSGYDVAARMGMLARLRDIQTHNTVVRYVDPTGHGRGRFDYDRFAAALDGRAFTFMRGDLERVLYETLGDRVPVRYATTVDAVTEADDVVTVTLSDGTVDRVDLLVGADGIHSRVRELAFGPEQPLLRYLGFHTASYLCDDDGLRSRLGEQFLMVAAPDRQAGLYPTNDGRIAVWLTHRSADPTLPTDPRAALLGTYRAMGGVVDAALRLCPPEQGLYYDQVAQIVLDGWTRGRVTLVGDACQAVSLLAGQGASMAMGGAYVLADELRAGGPPTDAAARYERRMCASVRAKQQAGRRTANWLVPSSRWRIAARALGFTATRLPGGTRLARAALAGVTASVVTDHGAAPARAARE
jgi:2-polyprenyl-6-methoxyphenol hydroxylase-like FAD-dependent oxidoreductase